MHSLRWIGIKFIFLIAICNSVSARLFYWPGQSYYSRCELSEMGKSNVNFVYCGTESDIFQFDGEIKVTPELVTPGAEVTIEAQGTLSEDVDEGTYADVVVKLGLIKLIHRRFDLCEELRNDKNELQCPLKKGKVVIKQTVKLPKEIPPGKFSVQAVVYNAEDSDVTCLNVVADFTRRQRLFNSFVTTNLGQY
ncbi:unnamed protein product [Mucor hiemalis]